MNQSLPLERVNRFVLAKQHLARPTASPLVQVASDLAGVHATSSTAPYLSLAARLPSFTRTQLDDELYQRHTLVRVRCMRQTIYICPADWLPFLFAATAHLSRGPSEKYMLSRGISQRDYQRAAGCILELLSEAELPVEVLKRALPGERGLSEIVNLMCDEGLLVRGRPLKSWKDRRLQYAPMRQWFPAFDPQAVGEAEATARLIERYLSAFGPATLADIAWWTGLAQGRVRAALASLGPRAITVDVSGSPGDYWLLRAEFEAVAATRPARRPRVNALPELDAYSMGYKDRGRWTIAGGLSFSIVGATPPPSSWWTAAPPASGTTRRPSARWQKCTCSNRSIVGCGT